MIRCKNTKNQPSEVLLNNVVDKEFLELFRPLYFLTNVFCLRKFDINDNCVTPLTRRNFFISVLGMTIVYFLLIVTLKHFASIFNNPMVYAMYLIAYLQYAISYTILTVINVLESKINVSLLLNLHKINRHLHNTNDHKKVKYMIWITIFVLILVYVVLVFLKSVLDPLWNWSRATFITSTMIFDLEMLYVVFIIYFLECKTETWQQELNAKFLKSKDRIIASESELAELKEMFVAFKMIVDALELATRASKWMILFHFVIAFTQGLTYFQILIVWKNTETSVNPVVTSSHLFGVILWVLKSLITETTLCVSCEILYRRIAAAQLDVILYFGERPSSVVRRFKKNIFRLSHTRLEKMSPLGIFFVDAALPLRMAGLLANYIIVLLQFAFL